MLVFESRRGPGLLQDYRDIAKLMTRQDIWPDNAGWVSRVMPYVLISFTVMVVAMSLPLFTRDSPFGAGSDLITVIYLFALSRFFFFSIAGLDSNSTFSSLGASREVTLGVLVEPIFMLAFLVIALIAGSTNFAVIGTALSRQPWQYPIATVTTLVAAAFLRCLLKWEKFHLTWLRLNKNFKKVLHWILWLVIRLIIEDRLKLKINGCCLYLCERAFPHSVAAQNSR